MMSGTEKLSTSLGNIEKSLFYCNISGYKDCIYRKTKGMMFWKPWKYCFIKIDFEIVNKITYVICGLCGNISKYRNNKYFNVVDKYVDDVNKICWLSNIIMEIEYNGFAVKIK